MISKSEFCLFYDGGHSIPTIKSKGLLLLAGNPLTSCTPTGESELYVTSVEIKTNITHKFTTKAHNWK